MKIFEVPPYFGKRPTTWSIEVHDRNTLSIVITQVYSYRDRFDAMGVPGGRIGATDTSKGDYVRTRRPVWPKTVSHHVLFAVRLFLPSVCFIHVVRGTLA